MVPVLIALKKVKNSWGEITPRHGEYEKSAEYEKSTPVIHKKNQVRKFWKFAENDKRHMKKAG